MSMTVGIVSPGDMGSSVGKRLHDNGADVLVALDGRSENTRRRAANAGLRDVGALTELLHAADIVLSIVPPAEALRSAEAIAEELRPMDAKPAYADCNAVAPQTAHQIGEVITAAGATFIDACIIGPPLREGASTRFYGCGPDTSALEILRNYGLEVRVLGPSIGRASGLKMVYSASTKGATALWAQLLVAARLLGLEDALIEEFNLGGRQAAAYQQALGQMPPVPRNAGRWTGEMEEIASTFAALGLTPKMAEGAADLFRFIAGTPLSVENDGSNVPAETVLDELAGFLEVRS